MGTGPLPQPPEPVLSVGLIAALPAEVRCFLHGSPELNFPFALTPHLTGFVCGIGRDAAGSAARTLLGHNIDALVSWGTAGALSPHLRSGDLLLPEQILACDGGSFLTDRPWLERIRYSLQQSALTIHSGLVTETKEILSGVAQKQELHVRTGAIAVDMESAAIMENAAVAKIPCIAIRSVVDEADMAMPETLLRHLDSMGRPDFAGLLLEMCRSPRLPGTLWRLALAMHRATSTLKTIARRPDAIFMYGK